VHALTEQQVRRSFLNCSQGEAKGLALPKDFGALDWAELDLLGWRDPRAPLRGYLVVEAGDRPLGIAVRAADTRMSSRTTAMCLLCQTAQSGDAVSLFTARRTGEAGSQRQHGGHLHVRRPGLRAAGADGDPPWLLDRDPVEVVAERAAELRERVQGFVDAVRR
jgi:hypothetical protein